LFAFQLRSGGHGDVFSVDKVSARLSHMASVQLDPLEASSAMAYWRGDIYLFTGQAQGDSHITRVRPSDGGVERVNSIHASIVGAGVSTCARD
jgi:hypothetical protein